MAEVSTKLICYHCGDPCPNEYIFSEEKHFCCEGCKLVYEILDENNLCTFYSLNNTPGIKQPKSVEPTRFTYLEDPIIKQKLINFKDKNNIYITFHIPRMHCSSCIWLLENMQRINTGVISSRVDFLKKELSIIFDETKTNLKKIVEQLSKIGYEPLINLDSLDKKKIKVNDKSRIYRIGVAGFCLGNIMMLSFPEYFSGGNIIEPGLKIFFSNLILFLALPVFFFCSSEFFINAWKGIKQKTISIDIPISLGILAMFLRSSYEIISHTGTGYFDSMSGLVFFMLVGRKFQDYTFDSLSFERDYKSYFPIAVSILKNRIEKTVSVYNLKIDDKFLVRSNEIIPVDSILINGIANIDYSFATGESKPSKVYQGEVIFAGGKQIGGIIELRVIKEVSQSHLTQLWNRHKTETGENGFQKYVNAFSRWFILLTLFIATTAGLYWIRSDVHLALNAFTAVLIIACPCAFALAGPFTFGNILRILGKNKIYLKNNSIISKLADIDTIVFDKTGTLTVNNNSKITYEGKILSTDEQVLIYSLSRQSSHPLSQRIGKSFINLNTETVINFKEYPGKGISGNVNGRELKLGQYKFIGNNSDIDDADTKITKVYISIDGIYYGYFAFGNEYRPKIEKLIHVLKSKNYKLSVLSGDNNSEENVLRNLFGKKTELFFNQFPEDKSNYIKYLQSKGKKVMMIGDGLNDAGALIQSDAGLSVSDDINNFSPASDGIIDSSQFVNISSLLQYSKSAIKIIKWSFFISLIYNFIGLSFAVQGTLSPVIAAILMPVSTLSLVFFTIITSSIAGRKLSIHKTD